MNVTRSHILAASAAGSLALTAPRLGRAESAILRIGGTYSDMYAESFYAKVAGAFAKIGYDVLPQPLANAGAVAAALGGGSLELGLGDLISPVNAINKGVPITIVAAAAVNRPATDVSLIVSVARDSAIRSVRDLEGKSIAVPTLVGLSTAALKAWLPLNKVEVSNVRIVELPQAATIAAVQRGTVDAGILSEPFITLGAGEVRDIGHPLEAIAPLFLNTAWYANKTWFTADLQRARRVVAAIYETGVWCNVHRAETLTILAKQLGRTEKELSRMGRAEYATSLDPTIIQPVLDMATKYKIFDHAIDANSLITRV
jgi:ABC-type nitrate/sulfonate/bicarbonate transport system substrate-binding protein